MISLSLAHIVARLLCAVLFAGAIGYDRQNKNRPAGIRTHILVCMGAATIALIQKQIEIEAITLALAQPEMGSVIRSDPAKLIGQIVSGIGFLGAGTIIITKRSIMGLTTASSLWAVAGIGIALGMGYYAIATVSFLVVLAVLTVLKRVIRLPVYKHIEIRFTHPTETKEWIAAYFRENGVEVKDVEYDVDFSKANGNIYTNIYTIEFPPTLDYGKIVDDLSKCTAVLRMRAVNM